MGDDESRTPSDPSSSDALLAAVARAPDVTPHADLVGKILGRYRVERFVGRGGMGMVYRAHDTALGRAVALKVLPPSVLADPERRARFVREAKSTAAVAHPAIAAVYDVGEIDGRVFLAMELVDGETLRARIRRGPLPASQALSVARAIARGLAKAHEKGIVHRDLKPDNVMLGEDDEVKLLDFGLAKLRESPTGEPASGDELTVPELTKDGRVLGTPAYMSPEQAKGYEVDGRTDIFSLGVVLYEMLAGERPFQGKAAVEVLSAVTRDEPPPLDGSVPAPLREIVKRCLEKDPDARFASAKDLARALDRITGQSGETTPSSGATPPQGTDRARGRFGIAALVTAAAVAFAAYAMRPGARSTNPPHAPSAAVSSAAPASTGVAITAHPPPKSTSPEALAAYASALQNFRDGSLAFAGSELLRATKLDPQLAAAHLRLVIIQPLTHSTTIAREHFAAASQQRSLLEPRDLAMLRAAEELIRESPRYDVYASAMEDIAKRYPDDAEMSWMYGHAVALSGKMNDARKIMRHAFELDPQFAAALWYEASEIEEPDQALAVLDQCLTLSPSAASCLRVRAGIRSSKGDCAGFEADARRMTEVEPRGPRAYEYLADALAARNAPIDSVRAALDKRATLGVAGTREPEEMRAQSDLWVSLLVGDFVAAEAAANALGRVYEVETGEDVHAIPAMTLIDLLEESGQPERAMSVAEAFERRLPAWTPNAPFTVRARLVAMRARAGRLDAAGAEAARAALFDAAAKAHAEGSPEKARIKWSTIYGQYVSNADEARLALARKPSEDDKWDGFDAWTLGKVYLHAGKTVEARELLERSLRSCSLMTLTDEPWHRLPFSVIESRLLLGQAFEATDKERACDAYRFVIEKWRNAKPRSVSVEKARARSKALGCAVPS